jgi:sulfite reductase beta subunit-like hemoprotein
LRRIKITDLVGIVRRADRGHALGVVPVLGELTAAQLLLLADLAPEVIVTPWRTVLLPCPAHGAARAITEAGLVADPADPAARVSACAGRPGCAKARADVRADVADALAAGAVPAGVRIHVVACERRCGAPRAAHVEAVATGRGYRVAGAHHPGLPAALAAAVTHARRPRPTRGAMPRIDADRAACQGHAVCIAMADDVFDIDDDGVVIVVRATVDAGELERVRPAVLGCPVAALRIDG